MEIVINTDFGGFSVSRKVYDELGIEWDGYGYISNEDLGIDSHYSDTYRANQRLIKAIKKIGIPSSSGLLSSLKIVSIPDDVDWTIEEYDGVESIHEAHRSW